MKSINGVEVVNARYEIAGIFLDLIEARTDDCRTRRMLAPKDASDTNEQRTVSHGD